MIYIFKKDNLVKIGYTKNVYNRKKALEYEVKQQLILIYVREGTIQEERQIHIKLKEHSVGGEWYCFENTKIQIEEIFPDISFDADLQIEKPINKNPKLRSLAFSKSPFTTVVPTKSQDTKMINIAHSFIEILKDFSIPAFKLHCYILKNLKKDRSYINILLPEALHYCGYDVKTRASFYKGLNELIDKKLLAPSSNSSSEYWVNCDLMFNGNKVICYK